MIIATAGHVDHGKTALVKALTGVDTDRLEEEKARGLSINLGFAYTGEGPGKRLGFVDVPGHVRFIGNMLAGVACVDLALLTVAADDGVMPQTREHLDILNLLGIDQALVALTKIDRADKARLAQVKEDIQTLLAGTRFQGAAVHPVCALSGEGLAELQAALAAAAASQSARQASGRFRLAIDRRFTVKGAGLVVTGSVFAGQAQVGDELLLAPQMLPVRVRGLRTQDQVADSAKAGDRAAVNLTGPAQLHLEDIHRGNWLTANPGAAVNRFDARLRLLPSEKPLRHWTPVHLHTAANDTTARVAVLEGGAIQPGEEGLVQLALASPINVCVGDLLIVRDQGAQRTLGGGRALAIDSPARGRAKPERVALVKAVEPDDLAGSLARLLQLQGQGVALAPLANAFNLTAEALATLLPKGAANIGTKLALAPEHLQRHLQQATTELAEWHKDNPRKPGLPLNQLTPLFLSVKPTLAAKSPQAPEDASRQPQPSAGAARQPRSSVSTARQPPLSSSAARQPRPSASAALQPPLSTGATRQPRPFAGAARQPQALEQQLALATFVMERLLEQGKVERKGNLWALPGHAASLSSQEAALFARVEPLLAKQPTRPPVVHELAAQLKVAPKELSRLLEQATKLGLLQRPAQNRYFIPEGMATLEASLQALAKAKPRFTAADFRDATGIGRNLAIEILEHFDRTGLTRRQGDTRQLSLPRS